MPHLTPGQQEVAFGVYNHDDLDVLASIEPDLPGFGSYPGSTGSSQCNIALAAGAGFRPAHGAQTPPSTWGGSAHPKHGGSYAKVVGLPNGVACG